MTIKIEVGMQLYYHRSDKRMLGKDEMKTITKIGKKYFYLDNNIRCHLVNTKRNDKIIAFEVVNAGANGEIYLSKEDQQFDKNWNSLCYSLPNENVDEDTKKALIKVFKNRKKEDDVFFKQKKYLYIDPKTKDEFLSLNCKNQVLFEEYQDGKMKFVGKDVNDLPLSIYVHINGVSAKIYNEMTIQEIEDTEAKYDIVTENYIL